jgi:hypothetical protein
LSLGKAPTPPALELQGVSPYRSDHPLSWANFAAKFSFVDWSALRAPIQKCRDIREAVFGGGMQAFGETRWAESTAEFPNGSMCRAPAH